MSHLMCLFLAPAEDLDLTKETPTLILTEGAILGGGAFSRVSEVTEESTGNTYAMKRMRKSAVVQCPEHVYFEQVGCVAGAVCCQLQASMHAKMQHLMWTIV
jgi:cGMP-dependent protein kinase 2